jgi:hypothetical protein
MIAAFASDDPSVLHDLALGLNLLRIERTRGGLPTSVTTDVAEHEIRRALQLLNADAADRIAEHSGTRGIPPQLPPASMVSMTSSDVAEVLGITSRAVTALASRGSLPGRRVGRSWTFQSVVVADFAQTRPQPSPGAPALAVALSAPGAAGRQARTRTAPTSKEIAS